MEEELGGILKALRILGGEIMTLSGLGAALLDIGMSLQVSLQAVGYILALRDHSYAAGNIFQDVVKKEGIVRTS